MSQEDTKLSLYSDKDYTLNDFGHALDQKTYNRLDNLFTEYLNYRFSPREISHVMKYVVNDIELQNVLKIMEESNDEKI